MKFEEITGTITVTFEMDAAETLARICRFAADNLDQVRPLASAYAAAFTAAAMIARTHGDIPEQQQEAMDRVLARLEQRAA